MGVSLTGRIFTYLLIIFFVLLTSLPIIYITLSSFKTPQSIRDPSVIIPNKFTLHNYRFLIFDTNALRYLKNSFFIASGTMIVGLLILVPSTYVFARMEFPGKRFIFYAIVLSMLAPLIILILPISAMIYQANLFNKLVVVFIVLQVIAIPMYLWILRGYFSGFPQSYEEAARVFGCSGFQAFYSVMLPIAKDGILAVGFMIFLVGWSDYIFSNALIVTGEKTNFPMFMYTTIWASERTYWGNLCAQMVICLVPPLILFILAQRYLGAFSGAGE